MSFTRRRNAGKDNFEAKSEEVHQVVRVGGMLEVASIDQHSILELFHPTALVQAELAELGLGHGNHIVDDVVVLLVTGNGHRGPGDGAKFTAFTSSSQKFC